MQAVFVKVSGDVDFENRIVAWLRSLAEKNYVVICVGGGTQINHAFEKHGWPLRPHGPLGREPANFSECQVARDVLELRKEVWQSTLAELGLRIPVVIPVQEWGGIMCHLNGDEAIRAAYLGFDVLYVVTTPDRVEAKRMQFAELPKVRVIAFPYA